MVWSMFNEYNKENPKCKNDNNENWKISKYKLSPVTAYICLKVECNNGILHRK